MDKEYHQKIEIISIMIEHKAFTRINLKPDGKVEEKTYRYPYEKDEYIESVIKVANDLGIKLKGLIK